MSPRVKTAAWFVLYTSAWVACALALVSVLTGCQGTMFRVDSRFTPDEEVAIQTATNDWMAVGAHEIHFLWRQHVDACDRDNIIVKPGERAAMAVLPPEYRNPNYVGGTTFRPLEGTRILLMPERMIPARRGDFASAIAHELGHYYTGGDHLPDDPDAVMYPGPTATKPNHSDVRKLRAADPDSAARARATPTTTVEKEPGKESQ